MADYIRRETTPLLAGIGAPTLEAIVGELEIAVECRAADRAVGRRAIRAPRSVHFISVSPYKTHARGV